MNESKKPRPFDSRKGNRDKIENNSRTYNTQNGKYNTPLAVTFPEKA